MNYAQQAMENRAAVDDPLGADRTAGIVLGAAVVAMGLLAGLFYAFDVAVMPALTRADDRTLVDAMQQMIDAIENPVFFLTFLGAPVLAAIALFQARRSGSTETARWISDWPRRVRSDVHRHLRVPLPTQRRPGESG
jgi:hypothetical protein